MKPVNPPPAILTLAENFPMPVLTRPYRGDLGYRAGRFAQNQDGRASGGGKGRELDDDGHSRWDSSMPRKDCRSSLSVDQFLNGRIQVVADLPREQHRGVFEIEKAALGRGVPLVGFHGQRGVFASSPCLVGSVLRPAEKLVALVA